MRIVFMGTPGFAVPSLDALVAAGHEVAAAYSQPPRPGGRRGRELVPSPVQRRAETLGIIARTPRTLRDADEQAVFRGWQADVAIVAAYGLILPPPILAAPRHGCINIHASLLPRWRGAAPIQRAIQAGDAETGVCIMQMEAGLDTGPVRLVRSVEVTGDAGQLTTRLAALGAEMIVAVCADPGAHPALAQTDDGITYAAKVDKSELRLDFARLTAAQAERHVRAFHPPGAYLEASGERVRVLAAIVEAGDHEAGVVLDDRLAVACRSGVLRPTLVQRAGRGVMTPEELLRGFPVLPGTRL